MTTGAGGRVNRAIARVRASRVGRTFARYSIARGGLLAGGIAYSALFSIFAALALSFTVFTAVLGDNDVLRQTVIEAVNDALPGIVDDGSGNGLLKPEDLVVETALTPAGVLALVVLLWTALSVMAGIKNSIRAMFAIVAPPENVVAAKARDLAGYLALALGVLVTAVLGLVAGTLGTAVLDALGVQGGVAGFLLRALSLGVALLVDWAVFLMLFRVTAGVRPLRRDLLLGTLLGAVAAGLLRLLGTTLVALVDNPLLASFAAIVTLMLWVNLLARVTLIVASWTANPPAPAKPETAEEVHLDDRPNYVTESAPATLEWDHQPVTGTVLPDETLRPGYEPEREPRWPGLAGRYHRWRAARLDRRAAEARERYRRGAERAAGHVR
ncbi:YihY/virulence factor BrkB family protein [Georgenia yuyongxinii]|uniref:YihY/virulence factor BrkB family protein n=1 Tax=Georgenia yuyongxinii TaxID=2589797 RepID=A0A552WQT0_9MICO|nr:YihY/virulence factor BrkB family protein [Georgenia yuyongxinii]TRW45106.1 YihY/virulence factor BrkB family protein [Georgenia yuyongxinii]